MVQAHHPSQFGVKKVSETRRQGQNPKSINSRGEKLPEARAAEILQGGGGRNRTNHLHTAFGSGGTCHGKHMFVFHLCSCYTWQAHRYTDTKLNVIKCMFSLLSRYVITKHHVISQEAYCNSITIHLEKLTPKNVHNISNTKI